MEDYQEGGGVSLTDIWRSVKKKLWLVLIIVVVFTAGAGLLFGFAINPRLSEYGIDFHILYPSSATSRFPDGSPFYDFDIISESYLEKAKASDEAFASLDIKSLLKNDGIELKVNKKQDGGDTDYSLTVKASYFQNCETAEKFLRAVANVPAGLIVGNAGTLDFKLDEPTFAGASFEEKIKLMSELKKNLIAAYDEWIALYGGTYFVNGRTLSNHRASLFVAFAENTQEALDAEGENNGYYGLDLGGYESVEEAIAARRSQLELERELNESILAALKNYLNIADPPFDEPAMLASAKSAVYVSDGKIEDEGGSTTVIINPSEKMDISETVAYCVKRNEQIARQLSLLTEQNVKGYLNRLNAQFTRLQNAADTVAGVASSVYEKNTVTAFGSRSVDADGGINLALVIVISLCLSALIGVTAAYFADKQRHAFKVEEAPMPEEDGNEKSE